MHRSAKCLICHSADTPTRPHPRQKGIEHHPIIIHQTIKCSTEPEDNRAPSFSLTDEDSTTFDLTSSSNQATQRLPDVVAEAAWVGSASKTASLQHLLLRQLRQGSSPPVKIGEIKRRAPRTEIDMFVGEATPHYLASLFGSRVCSSCLFFLGAHRLPVARRRWVLQAFFLALLFSWVQCSSTWVSKWWITS